MCFGDHGLTLEIKFLSKANGTCDYCGASNVALITPNLLQIRFEALLDCYDPNENGKPLLDWLREDWFLFSQNQMDDDRALQLLGHVLNDSEATTIARMPSNAFVTDRLGNWDSFRKELIHENRFFPHNQLNIEELAALLPALAADDADKIPKEWFRARIQSGALKFKPSEMMAPPPSIASHGRANPAGIPYLYLGSQVETAIAETRPHTGEVACVADFQISDDLELIDLRNPRGKVSPFNGIGADNIGQMRYDLEFLVRLGDELTRPVSRHATAYDYSPSQYLCEFIKNCGYDGVIYRSSVSDGMNLALFYPTKAQIGDVSQHDISRVSVHVSKRHY